MRHTDIWQLLKCLQDIVWVLLFDLLGDTVSQAAAGSPAHRRYDYEATQTVTCLYSSIDAFHYLFLHFREDLVGRFGIQPS